MSFTYRENQNSPLTWSQLDGNFREVEKVQVEVSNQALAAAASAETATQASESASLSSGQAEDYASLAEEMARISVVRWCGISDAAPSARLDGSPLQLADEWGNSADSMPYYWNGSAWVALHNIARNFPFSFVAGQAQYDVGLISGESGVTTAGLVLWVEGTLVYDFTVNDSKKFTFNDVAPYADGAQMRIIINANFSPSEKLREDLASPAGSSHVNFLSEGAGAVSQSVQDKLSKTISPGDFATLADAISAVISAPSRFFLNNREAFILTVGAMGQFLTINAAIDAAVRMRPTHSKGPGVCEVHLLPGFVMQEQVFILDGSDLGWLRITSADTLVTIDPNYITEYLSLADDSRPAFGAMHNSVLPVIGCKFKYDSNLTSWDGVAVMLGSKVAFMPSSGVVRSRRGLLVFYNSESHCYPLGLTQGGDGVGAGGAVGADFSYARLRGMHVAYGSRACMGRSNFSHCDGDFGAYVIWASYADCYHSNASYTVNGTGFHARDGSFLNCRESNYSHCQRGVHALHNAHINARSRIDSATVGQWIGDGGKYCTQYAVLASNNSQVEAAELDASYCTGSAAISASDASSINFINGRAWSSSKRAVWAQTASNVNATGADVKDSNFGLLADGTSTIAAAGVIATGCMEYGALALAGSSIGANGGDFSDCKRGIEPREGASITARGATIANCTERAVSVIDGGKANVMAANLTNAGSRAITCRGGEVVATGADCTGAVNWAVEVLAGGVVKFASGIAGGAPLSQAVNVITGEGIIFYTEEAPPIEEVPVEDAP